MSKRIVAHVLIQPRVFERVMSDADNEAVDDLVRTFHAGMQGKPLVVAAQALGVLTADYCQQISEKGGESVCALQDIAGRGQDYLRAGDEANAALKKAVEPVLRKPKGRRKVT